MSHDVIPERDAETPEVPSAEAAAPPADTEATGTDEIPVNESPVDENPVDENPVDETPVTAGGVDTPGAESTDLRMDDPLAGAPFDQTAPGASVGSPAMSPATPLVDEPVDEDAEPAPSETPAADVEDGVEDDGVKEDSVKENTALPAPAVLADDGMQVPRGPSAELRAIVEALVFASPEPITPRMLYRLLADEPKEDVAAALNALAAEYESRPGLQMVEVAGGFQIVTRPELHEWVRRLFHERSTQKLTVQGLETLAVIAYRQPVTAAEITEIRGVNTSGVLTTLLERHLIKIVGRKNVVGRPFLYATTKEFLIRFGLKDLKDLPRIEDMAEALGFDPPAGLVEGTPKDEVLPLEEEQEGE
jgi:segregation and condensation protein B